MTPRWFDVPLILSVMLCLPQDVRSESTQEFKCLFAFDDEFDLASVRSQDATIQFVQAGDSRGLQVATGHEAQWPGVTLAAPDGPWDLSAFAEIVMNVTNSGNEPVTVNCRVDSPGGDGVKSCVTGHTDVGPGETQTLTVPLTRRLPQVLADKLYGMRGYPGGMAKDKGLDTDQITQLIVFVNAPTKDHTFQLGDVRAAGVSLNTPWMRMGVDDFFPMIDAMGQFVHSNWPGKSHSLGEMRQARRTEDDDLATHPGPDDWNAYGGWKAGPARKATGYFRTEKIRGRWWLVDPEGCLFWSHGVDCVGHRQGTTPISDREFYFADLPGKDSPLDVFYGRGTWAPHGYYQGRGAYRTYCFSGANLARKYGPDWANSAADCCHRRLRSWSMNTIANWSDSAVYLMRRTPYVVSISGGGRKPIEGSEGYWGKFPDPFDPSLGASLRQRMAEERGKSAGDPWCLGYFVDNELAWGDELSLAKATLASPGEQAAKGVFLEDLKAKYGAIEKLNAAWNTTHASWRALASSRARPDPTRARHDLATFSSRIADQYFRVCREAVKEVAPDNLYLGCRFAWANDSAAQAAASHCDVIGYNLYRDSVANFRLPEGIDKPVIIGEFHFGALDRGMFHTGLRPVENQQARAAAYKRYVTGALENPVVVGSHWFQYRDQATTGRGDGENYQIGLVDICDRPYPETIQAVREVGNSMYRQRYGID